MQLARSANKRLVIQQTQTQCGFASICISRKPTIAGMQGWQKSPENPAHTTQR